MKKTVKPLILPTPALLRHYAQTSKEKYVMTLLYLLAEAVDKNGMVWVPAHDQADAALAATLDLKPTELGKGVTIG